MNKYDKNRLIDMLKAANRAIQFTKDKTRSDLDDDDELLGFAVVRAVELVGEAASKVTLDTRNQLDEIEWQQIIGMRNRIVHDYLNVDYDIVWQVVTVNLPTLIEKLNQIIEHDT